MQFFTSDNSQDETEILKRLGRINKRLMWLFNLLLIGILAGYSYWECKNTIIPSSSTYIGFWGALGICYASCFAGILTGFLFGIPKTSSKMSEVQSTKGGLTTNTNMEQVSDWLTKLIVGAVLVDFPKLFIQIDIFGAGFGSGLHHNFGIGMIVFSFIGGFLCSYFFVAVSYSHSLNEIILSQNSRYTTIENLKTESTANTNEEKLQTEAIEDTDMLRKIVNQDGEIKALARSIIPRSFEYDADPWVNVFGGKNSSNGLVLSASVKEDTDGMYEVEIQVTGDSTSVLEENSLVVFFLHPTLSRYRRYIRVKDGKAAVTVYSMGAFTVGALVNGGATKLELNLANLPDAPKKFRDN